MTEEILKLDFLTSQKKNYFKNYEKVYSLLRLNEETLKNLIKN